eukprot:4077463-Prymnesium_polylepis.1
MATILKLTRNLTNPPPAISDTRIEWDPLSNTSRHSLLSKTNTAPTQPSLTQLVATPRLLIGYSWVTPRHLGHS